MQYLAYLAGLSAAFIVGHSAREWQLKRKMYDYTSAAYEWWHAESVVSENDLGALIRAKAEYEKLAYIYERMFGEKYV